VPEKESKTTTGKFLGRSRYHGESKTMNPLHRKTQVPEGDIWGNKVVRDGRLQGTTAILAGTLGNIIE